MDFLVNVECLEGLFDTWGVYGTTFNNNLTLGGPTPIGARKANLSEEVALHLAEVALNEQVSCLLFLYSEPSCPACPCSPVKVRLWQHANKSMAELALNEQVSLASFCLSPAARPAHADGQCHLVHTSTHPVARGPTPVGARKASLSLGVASHLSKEVLEQVQSLLIELS